MTQRQFAELLDPPVTQGLVSQWISGYTSASLRYALQIQRLTDDFVCVDDWEKEADRGS